MHCLFLSLIPGSCTDTCTKGFQRSRLGWPWIHIGAHAFRTTRVRRLLCTWTLTSCFNDCATTVEVLKKKVSKLENRIQKLFQEEAFKVDTESNNAFKEIFMQETDSVIQEFPEKSPQKLLWEEQQKCLNRNPKGMRWHPAIIRLCITLCAKSSGAYKLLQSSGFLTLPTQRTHHQYTQFARNPTGYNKELIDRIIYAVT